MKELRTPLVWNALIHDFNTAEIKPYNVLSHREFLIKRFKKLCSTKEAFAEELRRDLMHQYWSRCEYEMLLYVDNNRVYLMPWSGKLVGDKLDITDDTTLDWRVFANKLLQKQGWRDNSTNRVYVKFDIYDQLMFRFNEFVDFCWNYCHKYERKSKNVTNK